MAEEKCPVDHNTREIWLNQAKKAEEAKVTANDEAKCPVDHTARAEWMEKMGKKGPVEKKEAIEVSVHSSDNIPEHYTPTSDVSLPVDREISSIPRTGHGSNWVYPSQKQFYEAMKRKNWSPDETDMKTVVPIHNAVNERAWSHILMWERGRGGETCGGVQLTSFKGDSKKLTPRAYWNSLWGYEKPFDRHDWTISRCGKNVEYVIDFYGAAGDGSKSNMPSFHLDVRPKLNSFEGVKMRLSKAFGL